MGAQVMKWCECADPGCPVHKGVDHCQMFAVMRLFREDMLDLTGVLFCQKCGEDALASGVFRGDDEDPPDDDMADVLENPDRPWEVGDTRGLDPRELNE
jgi:hypothetical protein